MQLWLSGFLFIPIITSLSLAGLAASTSAQSKMEKLHVGYSAQAGSLAPIWITKEAGIFKKHGLDVELLFIPGGPTAAAALMSSKVPITVVGGPAVMSSNLAASDLVMIAGIVNTFAFQIVTVKGITSYQQLKWSVPRRRSALRIEAHANRSEGSDNPAVGRAVHAFASDDGGTA